MLLIKYWTTLEQRLLAMWKLQLQEIIKNNFVVDFYFILTH